MVLISSDGVLFYAHRFLLLEASDNAFNGSLGADAPGLRKELFTGALRNVGVSTSSTVFNVVLHTIYGMSCKQFQPSLEVLLQAVKALKTYGIRLERVLSSNTPLYAHIVAEMPHDPIDVFLVAAENNVDALAIAASAHLHSVVLPEITDEMAYRMGPRYLKRLVTLHLRRVNYLKKLLMDMPKPHEDTPGCGRVEQRKLGRSWALAAASLVWDIRPGQILETERNDTVEGSPLLQICRLSSSNWH